VTHATGRCAPSCRGVMHLPRDAGA
jgi:hypothetical protein